MFSILFKVRYLYSCYWNLCYKTFQRWLQWSTVPYLESSYHMHFRNQNVCYSRKILWHTYCVASPSASPGVLAVATAVWPLNNMKLKIHMEPTVSPLCMWFLPICFLCIYSSTYADSTGYNCAVLGYLLLKSWNSSTLATWCKGLTHLKRPWCWERFKARGEGDDRGWDGWMASPTQWTWVLVNSGSWWWTGRPGVLQSMRLQSQTRLSDWTDWTDWMCSQDWESMFYDFGFCILIRKTIPIQDDTF